MLDARGHVPAMGFAVRSTPELRHTHASQGVQILAFAPSSLPFPVPVTSFQWSGLLLVVSPVYRMLVTDG
jgi:hypothetical protein